MSCSNDQSVEQVQIDFGTIEYQNDEVVANSHMKAITYSRFASMVEGGEKNFVLVTLKQEDYVCGCWVTFHEEILVPWIKSHNVLVYLLQAEELETDGNDDYGIEYIDGIPSIAIFEEGSLKYQNKIDDESDFSTKSASFSEWMQNRMTYPVMFYLNKNQLDEMYEGTTPFTIYFSRSGCSDCSYIENHSLRGYFKETRPANPSYILDCDVEGICYYNGTVYSSWDTALPDAKTAYAQWTAFKREYGLAYSQDNPVGFDAGYVPTFFHINPIAIESEKHEGIDSAGVFFNDTLDKETLTITNSYFTEERLALDALEYLAESDVENKVLQGISLTDDNISSTAWKHEQTEKYHDPIIAQFLDWTIA